MRRNYWVVVANAVCAVALVGCHDASLVAPTSTAVSAPSSMLFAPTGHPTLDVSSTGSSAPGGSGSGSVDFVVEAHGGMFYVGGHAVYFPAASICDPATSSYGEGTWDSPCRPATGGVRIHAEEVTLNGRSWVDFTPALRFVPSVNPNRWVWMLMLTPDAVGASPSDLSRFSILYAHSVGGVTEDDAVTDATMRTYVDTWSGVAIRRVKHFSGYTASAGFVCDPSVQDCGAPPAEAPPQ